MGRREKHDTAEQRDVRRGRISARVIDEGNGYRELEGVRAIRISSGAYRLLILEDYTPTLGCVEGDVVFLMADREVALRDIRGYYKHRHNAFTLLVQEDRDRWCGK